MRPLTLANETRTLVGDTPDIKPLSICDINENGIQYMVTLWKPTEEELAQIIAGCPVKLAVMGRHHPPVFVAVEEDQSDG